MCGDVTQLPEADDELDFVDAAVVLLEVERVDLRDVPPPQRVDAFERRHIERRTEGHVLHAPLGLRGEFRVARHGAHLHQREAFPSFGFRGEILFEPLESNREHARVAVGPEPRVHIVEHAMTRRFFQAFYRARGDV